MEREADSVAALGRPQYGTDVHILPEHRMDSESLRKWQIKKIHDALAPTLGYLSRLQRRMELKGFPPDDPLFQKAVKAQAAMQSLVMELHYLSCDGGVGRPRRPDT